MPDRPDVKIKKAWVRPVWRRTPLFFVTILATLCIKGLNVLVVASVSDVCLSRVRYRILSEIGATFRRLYRKSGSPSKNMTSDFALEVAKYPKSSPKWGSRNLNASLLFRSVSTCSLFSARNVLLATRMSYSTYSTYNRSFGIHGISNPGASPGVDWVGHVHHGDAM